MQIKKELSLSLIGLAGGLLVGNFAAFNGFLGLANATGDETVTYLLTGATALLTSSIIFGGRGISLNAGSKQSSWFNFQAWAGLLGLIAVLSMPVTSVWFREVPDSGVENQVTMLQDALVVARAERASLAQSLETQSATIQDVVSELEALQQNQRDAPSE